LAPQEHSPRVHNILSKRPATLDEKTDRLARRLLDGIQVRPTSFSTEFDGNHVTGNYGTYYDSDVPQVQEQITLDIYQHPTKRTEPHRRYQSAYDMYSLGLVLLEIGLWQPLVKLVPSNQNAYEMQRHILDKLHPRLVGQCGETYGDVVRDCLSMERQKSDTDKERQRSLALKMYSNLGRCFA
jgi:hypothetical protein